MLTKMSETQRSMLQDAAGREDRLLQPPANAKGAAAKSIADKLIEAGWAKESKAPNGAPIWRRDATNGSAVAIRLTARGLRAIRGPSEGSADFVKPLVSVTAKKATKRVHSRETGDAPVGRAERSEEGVQIGAAATASRAPRTGSKLDQVLIMMTSDAGATIADLTGATGWLEHTTRAALTGLRRRGYELTLTRGERNGASVYRVAARGHEAAK